MRDVLRCFLWVWVFVDCDLEGRDGVIVVGGGNGWGGRVSECMHHLSHPSRRTYLRAGLLVDRHQDVPVIMWCVGGKREGWVFMIVIRGGEDGNMGACVVHSPTAYIQFTHPPTHPPINIQTHNPLIHHPSSIPHALPHASTPHSLPHRSTRGKRTPTTTKTPTAMERRKNRPAPWHCAPAPPHTRRRPCVDWKGRGVGGGG